jgi:uncharacterized iron-regulated membrane protein
MSITGVLLAYERQINAWEDRSYGKAPAPGAQRLTVDALVERARQAEGGAEATGVSMAADPAMPAAVQFKSGTVLIDAYTGEVLGRPQARQVFRIVKEIHRTLGFGLGGQRDTGRAITGAANAVFFFLVVSGFYLWWPRTWSRPVLRAITLFDGSKRGRLRDWNWHHATGFWSAPVLFVVVLSGVGISYGSLYETAERLLGQAPPPRPRPIETAAGDTSRTSLETLWTQSTALAPDWRTISLPVPEVGSDTVRLRVLQGDGPLPLAMSQLTLDSGTGDLVQWRRYEDGNAVQKVRAWGRWLHTGEALGVFGQTLAAIASAGGALLVWTGLALTWRRYVTRRPKQPPTPQSAEPFTMTPPTP